MASTSHADVVGSSLGNGGAAAAAAPQLPSSPSRLDPSLCRHFVLRGVCRFRDDCHYSHVLPDDCADWNDACQRIPCPHYQRGICRYASMCRLAHEYCVVIDGSIVTSEGETAKESTFDAASATASNDVTKGRTSAAETKLLDEPLSLKSNGPNSEDDDDLFCGICLEPLGQMRNNNGEIEHNRKKFGLLSACDHIFCIHCLRTWRHQQKKRTPNRTARGADDDDASDRVRACPACRQASDFVVPSDRYCVGEDKKQVVASYQARLSCTPCKRFNGKLGSCPFGSDCFYAHWDRQTGQDTKSSDKTKQELWKEKMVKKRLKEERRRQHQRRSMFPGMAPEEIDAIQDMIYLSSMDRFLSSMGERDADGEDDSEGEADVRAGPRILTPRLISDEMELFRQFLYSMTLDRPNENS